MQFIVCRLKKSENKSWQDIEGKSREKQIYNRILVHSFLSYLSDPLMLQGKKTKFCYSKQICFKVKLSPFPLQKKVKIKQNSWFIYRLFAWVWSSLTRFSEVKMKSRGFLIYCIESSKILKKNQNQNYSDLETLNFQVF